MPMRIWLSPVYWQELEQGAHVPSAEGLADVGALPERGGYRGGSNALVAVQSVDRRPRRPYDWVRSALPAGSSHRENPPCDGFVTTCGESWPHALQRRPERDVPGVPGPRMEVAPLAAGLERGTLTRGRRGACAVPAWNVTARAESSTWPAHDRRGGASQAGRASASRPDT